MDDHSGNMVFTCLQNDEVLGVLHLHLAAAGLGQMHTTMSVRIWLL